MRIASLWMAAALTASLAAQTPAVPDTPAGRIFTLWLDSFNSGDRARVEAFAKEYNPGRANMVDQTLEIRKDTGGLDLAKIIESKDRSLRAQLKMRESGQPVLFGMELKPEDPPVIARIMLRPDDGEAEGPPPARLSDKAALEALDQEAAARTAKDTFAGAVLVAKGGKVVFEKAYGLANRASKSPNTVDTRFRLGSMNKMFTSVATLQLVAQGKLSLDEPIARYWPDYPNAELAKKVKIRHLLSHTGGTGDIFGPEFDQHRLELKTLADYAKLYGKRDLKFEPGTRWEYSNYGFLLLGLMIEKVSGQSYYDYVREHIFIPAGMKATDSLPESENVTARATGYMHARGGGWTPNTDTLPWRGTSAGGGYSTVGDLARFAWALEAGKLIPKELLAQASQVQFKDPNAPPGMGYGFGFIIGNGSYGHGGGAPGMNGELSIHPKTARVVVVLSNLDPPAATRLEQYYEQRMPLD